MWVFAFLWRLEILTAAGIKELLHLMASSMYGLLPPTKQCTKPGSVAYKCIVILPLVFLQRFGDNVYFKRFIVPFCPAYKFLVHVKRAAPLGHGVWNYFSRGPGVSRGI